MEYLDKVGAQLKKMLLEERDAWVLMQAELISNYKQNDSLTSLSGTKRIIDMPTPDDIDTLCTRIETDNIYLEYITHYYKFNEDSSYMDDWVVWYSDPFSILPTVRRILAGCHQLVMLEEYRTIYDLLSRIFGLKLFIQKGENSEDAPEEEYIKLSDSRIKGELSYNLNKVTADQTTSFTYLTTELSDKDRVEKLIKMLETSISKNLKLRILKDLGGTERLFVFVQSTLEITIIDPETREKEILKVSSRNRKLLEAGDRLTRSNEPLTGTRIRCLKGKKMKQMESFLEDSWNDVCEVVEWSSFEKDTGGQPEADTVLEVCKKLVQSDEIQYDEWQSREKVLTDVVEHDYYDNLGAFDTMEESTEKLYVNDEEYLAYVDTLYINENKEKAALLYNQHGRKDKYITYLENHLGSEQKNYSVLITYYDQHNQEDDAIRVAQLGLRNCKDSLTDIFILLLLHTRENDTIWFKKLFTNAKRRKDVDMTKIDIAMQG